MAAREFQAKVRHRPGVGILDLSGEIDLAAEATLSTAYEQALAQDPPAVLLNFEGVDYINSTGIALIVGVLARARTQGRTVSACGLSDHYREIFQITRLSDFMGMYPDEQSAVGEIAATAG